MRKLIFATCAAMTLACTSAEAAHYMAMGAGTLSCGSWTAARSYQQSLPQKLEVETWILGFLSGIGFEGTSIGDDPLQGVDAQAVWAWVDNFCRANPPATIANAGGAFAHEHPNVPVR